MLNIHIRHGNRWLIINFLVNSMRAFASVEAQFISLGVRDNQAAQTREPVRGTEESPLPEDPSGDLGNRTRDVEELDREFRVKEGRVSRE